MPHSDALLDAQLEPILGSKNATALKKAFGFHTVGEFLSHYPRRYARRGELTAITDVPLNENVTIVAEVLDVRERPMRARRGSLLEVRITDGRSGGIMTLTFFNQAWRAKDLKPGVRGIFAGKVGTYRGALQLAHPDYELFDALENPESSQSEAARWALLPIPIYPATSTLASWQIAKMINLVLEPLRKGAVVSDPVPEVVRAKRSLLPLSEAVIKIHQPEIDTDWKLARETLRFHEAFILQATLLEQRAQAQEQAATPRPHRAGGYLDQLDARLPFTLTPDQQKTGEEISEDMSSSHPMNRLVQGEVGSGKTLVALRAMLQVADSGGQAALLAPTEVLAAQHLRSIVTMLGPDLAASVMPTLLTGQLPAAAKRQALLRAVSGQARIVIGTHALLSDKVEFFDLGLVVVDEQHRFGVEQRQALRLKSDLTPHVLVLTATPIPRTVAMTVFGDLDVSVIAGLPEGRAGITSHAVYLAEHPNWITRVWERVEEEIASGRQAFVVCPAIDASGAPEEDPDALIEDQERESDGETPPKASVEAVAALLTEHPLLGKRRIAQLHGRMSSEDKDAVMQAFSAGEIDLIVATTVIEVGVDVPNASTMVVLDADRFGVSQLHQLRGRVGRGGVPGLALFVTHAQPGTTAHERVEAVASTLDGFELARIDLELRSEGNVLGTNQSGGRSSLRLLRAARDGDLIAQARQEAAQIIEHDPDFSQHVILKEAIARRLSESERDFLDKN
ncbi:ATP-dependent DNA helicase RecG [Aurantimicrobium sp. MWH-Uga1]|uniref:ATP-dependent DNA helicase RecG n=1 Tax=Aurantimicrobium sp. MWH-Uga1 TaxID=2079575 RepID=UPI000DED9AC9|nr:ATP-dependent DNA helicase RecG [Aurantimicrobium sp. MWH-Uga1]AXE54757.1 ATP-dependent DNA helicase RecG [Aurantimicrobium sp. MWH-Uga1]